MNAPLGHIEAAGDLSVGLTLGGQQHDLRADHFAVRAGVLAGTPAQLFRLGLAQLDLILAGHYPRDSPALWKVLQPAQNIFPGMTTSGPGQVPSRHAARASRSMAPV